MGAPSLSTSRLDKGGLRGVVRRVSRPASPLDVVHRRAAGKTCARNAIDPQGEKLISRGAGQNEKPGKENHGRREHEILQYTRVDHGQEDQEPEGSNPRDEPPDAPGK